MLRMKIPYTVLDLEESCALTPNLCLVSGDFCLLVPFLESGHTQKMWEAVQ